MLNFKQEKFARSVFIAIFLKLISSIYAYMSVKMYIMQTEFVFKSQIKITENLKSGPKWSVAWI